MRYVAYLDDVQCCSFALDMYVVFEGVIGVEVSSQVSDFGWSFDWFSYDIYCGVGCIVELLPAPEVNEFGLTLIKFELYSFQPGLDILHGSFHDGKSVVFW